MSRDAENPERDLTGRWLGRYDYDSGEGVPFEADLTEQDGTLTGQIDEPNTFDPDAPESLTADIRGVRQGAEVSFEKLYHGFAAVECPTYNGTLNPALTRISGTWSFRAYPGHTGRFVMMRKPRTKARAKRSVAAVVE